MKVVSGYVFRAVCALIVGILLVANPETMTVLLVQIIGGLFLISGLVSLLNYVIVRYSSKVSVMPVFPLVGAGSSLFGVFLCFFPGLFIAYLMYVLGFLMLVAGINQLWGLFSMRKLIPFSWYGLLTALLITLLGLTALFNPLSSASMPFILLGATFIVYGISEMVNGVRWRKYTRMRQAREIPVEAIEVKEEDNNVEP